MTRPAGTSPAASQARPAVKGITTQKLDPAEVRQVITALVELSESQGQPMRRKVARELIVSRLKQGRGPDEIIRGARNSFGVIDETGGTAAANLDRANWAATVRRRSRQVGGAA